MDWPVPVEETMKQSIKGSIKFWLSSLVMTCVFIGMLIVPVVRADEIITDMSDLPVLEEELSEESVLPVNEKIEVFNILKLISTQRADNKELNETEELVIIYEEDKENNLGSLNLKKDDFSSGKSLSGQVDVLKTSGETDSKELIEEIKDNDNVLAVSPNTKFETFGNPNDTLLSSQYNLSTTGAINVWNQGGSNAVKIAVIDSGVNWNHEDLAGRVDVGSAYDANGNPFINGQLDYIGHGTAVSGVIAAATNNGKGIAGIAGTANVQIVPFRVTDSNGDTTMSSVANALVEFMNRSDIKVANFSLGIYEDLDVLRELCDRVSAQGKMLVCATGNDERNSLAYPARYTSTLAVGAVDSNNKRCTPTLWGAGGGSSYGPGIDMVAPGHKIPSVNFGNDSTGYSAVTGTSFASPAVAGTAALMLTKNPSLSVSQLKATLTATAKDLGSTGYDEEYGYGLLQTDKALNAATSPSSGSGSSQPTTPSTPNNNNSSSNNNSSNNSSSSNNSNSNTSSSSTVAIYRLYNSGNGEHLYTTSREEVSALVAGGWTNEGMGWYAPSNGTPVYRLYNAVLQNHLYTTDLNEIRSLTSQSSWSIDFNGNPIFFSGGSVPIYRVYNRNLRGLHHLTTDAIEYTTLPAYGWTPEGVAIYAVKAGR